MSNISFECIDKVKMYAIIIVCMFLQNIYTCYYGNKVQASHCIDKYNINDYINANDDLIVVDWFDNNNF